MGTIPSFGAGGFVSSDENTQIGCGYCLGENVDAPSTFGVAYLWQGTSMCARHFRQHVMGATSATTTNAAL
jgi:hypothetical protein